MSDSVQRVAVALLGARMHYAVPRILHQAGRLEMFFTDLCASKGWPQWLKLIPQQLQPPGIKRICSRLPAGIPPDRITAFNNFGFEYARRRARATGPSAMTEIFLWANRRFGELVCGADWRGAHAVFTFNCAGLEIMQRAKRDGPRTIMEQTIAPSALEQRLLREERELHPGWEQPIQDNFVMQYSQREQAEWLLADQILCGSEYVREGIHECGGPVEKCVVVPYGVDLPSAKQQGSSGPVSDLRRPSSVVRPLRVLTVGAVGLRKGSPYVLEAAKQLKGKAVFRMVGGIGVTHDAEAQLREHLELAGPVPRSEIAEHFAWADVFLLPSLCEGSAAVTYEALAHGLPVICTPNTGSVIRDRIEGFIVPIRDGAAIAEKLGQIAADPALREEFSCNARNRAEQFTVRAYGEALLTSLQPPKGLNP